MSTFKKLCGIAGLTILPVCAQAEDWWQDSQLIMQARNVFWQQNYQVDRPSTREWGQGLRLDFSSGDTSGLVKLGVEASLYSAVKLDQKNWAASSGGVLPRNGDHLRDASAWVGGAIRLRAFATEFRYGNNLRPSNPVFAPADTRLLPSTATGWWLISNDIPDTMLEAGYITAGKDYRSDRSTRTLYAANAGVSTDRVAFLGGSRSLGETSGIKLYAAEFQNIWRQYYANAYHGWSVGRHQQKLDANIYHTRDQGGSMAGEIDVTAWSLAFSHTAGAHTVSLSYQQIDGNQPFDYLGMAPGSYHDSIYLANSSQMSDFNGPHEKSWGVFYDVNMTAYGVPGLSLHARYILGHGADGGGLPAGSPYAYYGNNEKHWTAEADIRYAVQEGWAKGLAARLRFGLHRMVRGTSNVSSRQVRLYLEYPFTLL